MFGKHTKTQSAASQFIMARGKSVGNLKDVKKSRPKEQPPKVMSKVKTPILGNVPDRSRTKLGSLGMLKEELKK